MSDDKVLDNAIKLFDIEKKTGLDYDDSKPPHSVDEEIIKILTAVIEGTPVQREEFVSLLNLEVSKLLHSFAYRMSIFSVRTNSYEHLLKGLVALAFAAVKIDYREILMALSLFYRSAIKLNLSPEELFKTASQYATHPAVRELILDYLARAPEDKNIEQMGFREVDGPSGLIYQIRGQPIPQGWL